MTMKNKKLCVAGCSFSDYLVGQGTSNETVYGEELARLVDRHYIHEGAGCGSNWRIWRRITGMVLDGEIDEHTWLFIQYTGKERTEFWSDKPPGNPKGDVRIHTRDEYLPYGSVLRYKQGSGEWQQHREEQNFFTAYERHHVLPEFCEEQFRVHNLQFQTFLAYHGIPTVFMYTRHGQQYDVLPEFKRTLFTENWDRFADTTYNYHPTDCSHMNDLGHRVFAEDLLEHVKGLGWV